MKLLYVLYSDKDSNRVKVEISGLDLNECEAAALTTPGVNRIAWARLLEGEISLVERHPQVIVD